MGQINLENTDSPETPSTGRTGIFINISGQAKKIDDAGVQTDLGGGGSLYPEMAVRENNQLLFDNDYSTGLEASARTGNITASFTGALRGTVTVMRHNDSSEPTYPSEVQIISGAYVSSVDNYLFFILVNKTASSEIVLCTIHQEV